MKRKILYYPTIELKDGRWLRNALLYWDKISTIVPSMNYDEIYSRDMEALESQGIYEPTYPWQLESDELRYLDFCHEIENMLKVSKHHTRRNLNQNIHRGKLDFMRVHIDKTPLEVQNMLQYYGVLDNDCEGPWIRMDDILAKRYMSILAKYLARLEANTAIGTEHARSHLLPYSRTSSTYYSKALNYNKYLLGKAIIEDILPMPNLNIPFEDILNFKDAHKRELSKFMEKLASFEMRIKACESEEELNTYASEFENGIQEDFMTITESLRSEKINFSLRTFEFLTPIIADVSLEIVDTYNRIPLLWKWGAIALAPAVGYGIGRIFERPVINYENSDMVYLFKAMKEGII